MPHLQPSTMHDSCLLNKRVSYRWGFIIPVFSDRFNKVMLYQKINVMQILHELDILH